MFMSKDKMLARVLGRLSWGKGTRFGHIKATEIVIKRQLKSLERIYQTISTAAKIAHQDSN